MGLTLYLHSAAFHLPGFQTDKMDESDRGGGRGEENKREENRHIERMLLHIVRGITKCVKLGKLNKHKSDSGGK